MFQNLLEEDILRTSAFCNFNGIIYALLREETNLVSGSAHQYFMQSELQKH